jgi:mRNA-degrading endonuclease RelE of RelBE toxin-antitoxin system
MIWTVLATKNFILDLKEIQKTRKSITKHIKELDEYLSKHGIDQNIKHKFDIEPLADGYFRFKFIPYRVIIKVEENTIYFKKIFKRK